ncbi:ankyrin repeat domain-containing protein [Fuerstiella marisgermanici]|uniref:Ankyrin repeat protein n=1 Tax=Fuerstiella marisgermanici TaxID=1891926 RepID=A0A1P8WRB6_9PLAN|nr:ankyrin repeat domain-containing protein [Fuerstiella marisgermanici]APZ96611.1 ankyrin repeat protein [Fuerstiella marisgermanici]
MSNDSDAARTDRPNLEQKRKLAKELLRAVRSLDGSNAARFTWNHPRFRGKTPQDVIRDGVSLTEAQHVIARESGFESWPKLKEYIRLLEVEPGGPAAAFEDAVRATIRGDAELLRELLGAHPEIATMRSTRQHKCVLLHYIAANGVENEHQIVPSNAPEITRLLFDAGAAQVVDATTEIYGGGPGSTPLVALVSSSHPHQAGVHAELVHLFCQAGASVNGIEDDGLPMAVALGFRYPNAAEALASCGARIDNLPTAAGIGQFDLVEAYLNESLQLVSNECHFPNPRHNGFSRSVAPHPSATLQQALVFSCMSGHVAIAKLLLDHGVGVNGGPRRGITALHESCYQGEAEAAHLLLQHGADPTLRDEMWESTAIGWADGGNQDSLTEWLFENSAVDILDAVELRRYRVVRQLLEADPTLADAPHGSGGALRFTAFKGDTEMAELLLEFQADPTLRNENGHSALDYAKRSDNQGIIRLLNAATEKKLGE